ncbi:hypothetical protein HPB51_028281 [Rhipicephalus microplus]|uniref:Uncharacterized protein n=1 Tax=Rhipicephalus microplus TaxID=6941 RepID=A0A9J6CY16_RHIMP|nr:hypothetical protein HPB51_028281 [Rhipicephalus microplus]
MPRAEPTEGVAAKPDLSPAASGVSRGSSPSLMSRHRQSSDVVIPQTASTVSRHDLANRRQRVPGSKATKSPSDSKPFLDAAVGRSRSIAGPASSASPVHSPARAQRGAVPASTTCSRYAPRIILPHRYRGGGGGAKRAKSPMKPAAKASVVAAGGLNEPPRTPVSSDSTEKKSEDEGKTRDSVESVHLSRLQGTRTSISIVAKSSPYESSLNATHQRASSGHTMLSEEVLERMHSLERITLQKRRLPASGERGHQPPQHERRPLRDDIEAHVCGAISGENGLITDTASKMMLMWMRRGAQYLESKSKRECTQESGVPLLDDAASVPRTEGHSQSMRAAFSLYSACLAPAEECLSQLKAFMKGRGMTWPQYGADNSQHAAYVMLDLLINWGVPFWFEMSLRRLPNDASNMDMLYTLGWWFAQQFSVMASLDGSIASYGSATTAAANRQSDCYALAESRFRRQLFLQRAHASLGYPGMRQVDDIFSNIRDMTVTLLHSLAWMEEAARSEAVAIVEATEFEVWKRYLGNHNDDDDSQEGPQ